jgi:hypothetical protein
MKKNKTAFLVIALFALAVIACDNLIGGRPADDNFGTSGTPSGDNPDIPGDIPDGGDKPGGGDGGGGGGDTGSTKAITALSINGEEGFPNPVNRTVIVTFPRGTDLTNLSPEITHNGADINPTSGVSQNFYDGGFSPVHYTVTAVNGSEAVWTVMVRLAPLSATDGLDTGIEAGIEACIDSAPAGDPVPLPVAVTLPGDWPALLTAINARGRNVALDLSGCTMSGTEFNPAPGGSKGKIVSLVLPDTAASVNSSFQLFTNLKSLTAVGVSTGAFQGCISLTEVSLPAATYINFNGCSSLTSVSLPMAGGISFNGCSSLTTVSLPAATYITGAFNGCSSLTTLSLPATLTRIDAQAFTGCTGLETITIDDANGVYKHSGDHRMILSKDGTTLIAYPAASGTVTLDGISGIGQGVFENCTGLTEISSPDVAIIGGRAFYSCSSLTTVSLPAAAIIGGHAFYDCSSLTTLSLPAATSIGSSAFNGCSSLTTVSLPAATSIGEYTFCYCSSLTTLDLPLVTSIGERAFRDTGGQSLIVTLGTTVPVLRTNLFEYVYTKSVTVRVPAAAFSGYDAAWKSSFTGGNSNISLTVTPY